MPDSTRDVHDELALRRVRVLGGSLPADYLIRMGL